MRIAFDEDRVTVQAPAKLNLFLELLARRADGYHDLETLMVAVDLCDQLSLQSRDDGELHLVTDWAATIPCHTSLGDVPAGHDNIVVQALERLRERAGVSLGANIRLRKRIPSAAGLGGASSDAAAALLGANVLWDLRWTTAELSLLAAELGSDVPFFLGASAAVCRGRGEQIEPLPSLPRLDVVIVRPPEGLSTPAVYGRCQVADSPASVDPAVAAWRRGDIAGLARHMTNRLEPAAEALSPWIARLRAAFAEQNCYGHQMSGSGTSYFGLCRHALHARQVASRLRARDIGYVVCTRTISLLAPEQGDQQAA
jgi:4-diphosphocytidyl-2-C-methyl-D-erythritol kinase